MTTLPDEIGQLVNLTKLNVSHNKLTNLPNTFFKLKELTHLNISRNEFSVINNELSDLIMLEILVS